MMNDEDAKAFWKMISRMEKSMSIHTNGFLGEGKVTKRLQFPDQHDYDFTFRNLEQLKKDLFTFEHIKIPDFDVYYDPDTLTIKIESEFIRGSEVKNDRKWTEIIWREIVERKGEHTFASLHNHNFRVRDGNIYYVDLDDYKPLDMQTRIDRFLKHFTR